MIELLKRWLRAHAVNRNLEEDDVARISNLLRDLLNHSDLFPSHNARSFMRTVADVYDHLQRQLRDVLEHDRTCAELATRVLSLSRNLVSDAVAFLILGPTDLTQTDTRREEWLPSLEVVSLWASITPEGTPLPAADEAQQNAMREAWGTYCGALMKDVLSTPWTIRVFHGTTEDDLVAKMRAGMIKDGAKPADGKPTRHPADSMREHMSAADPIWIVSGSSCPSLPSAIPPVSELLKIAWVAAEFDKGNFNHSGLAGPFRQRGHQPELARLNYLYAVQGLFDLLYLLSEVLTQFHRISDGLGDYGLIRIAPWLHPCLDSMVEKVQALKGCLEVLNEAVDTELVLAKARGVRVKKPRPSELMSARAHSAIQRAIASRESHVQVLLVALKELRERSSPERMPHVQEGLGSACLQLQGVLESAQFRQCVGDVVEKFPPLRDMGAPMQEAFPALLAAGGLGSGSFSSDEDDEEDADLGGGAEQADAQAPPRGVARARTLPAPPPALAAPAGARRERSQDAQRRSRREPGAGGAGQESRSEPADDRPVRAISMDQLEPPSPAAGGNPFDSVEA
ncbi:unnamed protein product [Prorocentrum cordatum]|uniref:Uncharacterized protein n=1 Tax=Prorocentrum cordatum TaxID=2364126 RepID=A0ABN9QP59_9DINO|nr:unnamed protein product [Polarella glacialis]